jgi:anthranilate phosphoribosyltransferase
MNATLERLLRREDLALDEARGMMDAIMSGAVSEPQIAALLTALRMKGETVAEITGFAAAMRAKAIAVAPQRRDLVDTCGTGGDAGGTFNISTATALVAAAMGIPVAKHGNRAISSRCGSADVWEALGVRIDLEPDAVATLIDRVGIGFLFAPRHHPAMKHAAAVRRALGVRTVFNLLGPLTNPAGVKRQLIGVFRADLTETLCGVLQRLGGERAFVVHGHDGTDEVSLAGETRVAALENGAIRSFDFAPEQAGLARAPLAALAGGTAAENAATIEGILGSVDGPPRDAVLLNAGFVAVLADRARNVGEGVGRARETIESGAALRLLSRLREASHALAG